MASPMGQDRDVEDQALGQARRRQRGSIVQASALRQAHLICLGQEPLWLDTTKHAEGLTNVDFFGHSHQLGM